MKGEAWVSESPLPPGSWTLAGLAGHSDRDHRLGRRMIWNVFSGLNEGCSALWGCRLLTVVCAPRGDCLGFSHHLAYLDLESVGPCGGSGCQRPSTVMGTRGLTDASTCAHEKGGSAVVVPRVLPSAGPACGAAQERDLGECGRPPLARPAQLCACSPQNRVCLSSGKGVGSVTVWLGRQISKIIVWGHSGELSQDSRAGMVQKW